MATAADRFSRLSTPAKLLLILTLVLLPIGFGLGWVAYSGLREANRALDQQAEGRARVTARALESLIARNALALRIAANGRLNEGPDVCDRVRRSLSIAPAVEQNFRLDSDAGLPVCAVGDLGDIGPLSLIAPGDIQLRIAPTGDALVIRNGIIGGVASTILTKEELERAATEAEGEFDRFTLDDGQKQLDVVMHGEPIDRGQRATVSSFPIANGRLAMNVQSRVPAVTTLDRLLILLPLLMWFIAAMITWLLVTRLLIHPLRRLQRAVAGYQPGQSELLLPGKVGPATEIQDLRDAFGRAVTRVQESEVEMGAAPEGQRRLVREVHHRVKNNLQVVASLLNIHGRAAESPAARAAYASIGRRVGALAIVHRNHFAEMEENRGLSLRPLLSELAAELRAGAPESARGMSIELDLETVHCGQDAAVSIAFLITEVVEFAMLNQPDKPVTVSLHRIGDLSARLTLGSPVLVPSDDADKERVQFERIIGGLAKQLRSNLERSDGRYSVEMAVLSER